MAYIDGLTDSCTIITITYSTDSIGQETKVETPLYTNVPCRFHRGTIRPRVASDEGALQPESEPWVMITSTAYDGANRGDRVVWEGRKYIITIAQKTRGIDGTHHMIYTVDEQE